MHTAPLAIAAFEQGHSEIRRHVGSNRDLVGRGRVGEQTSFALPGQMSSILTVTSALEKMVR
jgi:hypothetical protein